jgi:hypothetical protein
MKSGDEADDGCKSAERHALAPTLRRAGQSSVPGIISHCHFDPL